LTKLKRFAPTQNFQLATPLLQTLQRLCAAVSPVHTLF